jgi:hypothetical protein
MRVYVIAPSPTGPSKIGIAFDPMKRLRTLQTASSTALNLYFSEPIGGHAKVVEKVVHRALAGKRCSGGQEWFDVRPEEAHSAVQAAAAALNVAIDENARLWDIQMCAIVPWVQQRERVAAVRDDEGEQIDDEQDDIAVPSTLQLMANSVRPRLKGRFNFNDYLLTWEDGMWLRWAFERLKRRMPSGKRLEPYVSVADHFAHHYDPARRWIEWSAGRELAHSEATELAKIWDEFVPRHNLIERKGPQWATHGIDDYVDDVHLFALNRDDRRGDRNCVVFRHEDFRAVLVPQRQLKLWKINMGGTLTVEALGGVPVVGFVAPAMPQDIWERPFLRWLRDAPQRRDIALEKFLDNPNKSFPVPRPYDGPQPATHVSISLPRIDDDGTY